MSARFFGTALVLALMVATAHAQPPADQPAPDAPRDAAGDGILPHLRIDRDARTIDIDARVVLREGKWIELIACSPGSREHESLVVALAKPSHIHLALLTLGLTPGDPMTSEKTPDGFRVHPPTGPAVAVSFIIQEGGQTREVPVNQWVVQQKTGEVMAGNHFLFTGSNFVTYEDKQVYMADLNGTVVSLVNFGEDLLTRDTEMTNHSDNQAWNANTPVIPPLGTKITLRLRPVAPAPTD